MEEKGSGGPRGGCVNEDNFPAGLRVLAVDDDPICLKVLENLLRKCQYRVTTTNQAITALKMLRENQNKFDLVISDVNMPDMDGFKLLELVGLEMDLPVIMLSAHSDKELVLKGVTHGAVDYLLKPVRLEELKNIWQHVIRKKKLHWKDQNKSPNQDAPHGVRENGQGDASSANLDPYEKLNRKRKDQDELADEDGEENGNENEESGTQKKPRVVWSVELHRKFVASVNQLGLDKAVPKKILELMNVEGLTRENVASHLQKYRLYLKRISTAASQQASIVSAFGAKDSSCLRIGSLDGFGDFRTLSGPLRLSSTSLSSYSTGSMLGRLNSPAGLTLHGISSSGLLQQGHSTTGNSCTSIGKILPASHSTNLYQGIPLSLEANQMQIKSASLFGNISGSDEATGFTLATNIADTRVTMSSLGNTLSRASSNSLMLTVNQQQNQNLGAFAIQSSMSIPSLHQDSFDAATGSSKFLDHGSCNEDWQGGSQIHKIPTSSLPLSEPFGHYLVSNNVKHNMKSTNTPVSSIQVDFSNSIALPAPLENTRVDLQGKACLDANTSNTINLSSHSWDDHSQNYKSNANGAFVAMDSLVPGNGGVNVLNMSMEQRKMLFESVIGQSNCAASSTFQQTEIDRSPLDPTARANAESHVGFTQNNYDSFNIMEQHENVLMDEQFGFGAYSMGGSVSADL